MMLENQQLTKSFLCPGPGSNRHVFKGQWILSPSRLPIPPLGLAVVVALDGKGIEKTVIIKFENREIPELNVNLYSI